MITNKIYDDIFLYGFESSWNRLLTNHYVLDENLYNNFDKFNQNKFIVVTTNDQLYCVHGILNNNKLHLISIKAKFYEVKFKHIKIMTKDDFYIFFQKYKSLYYQLRTQNYP